MKKSLKYISLILAVIFVIAGCVMVACAEGENNNNQTGETPVEEPANPNQGTGGDTGTGTGTGTDTNPNPTPDPNPDQGTGGDTGTGNDPGYVDPGTGTNPDTSSDPGTGSGTSGGTTYDPGYSSNQQTYEEPMYYGNNPNYDINAVTSDETAGSVSQNNNLYNSSGISAADAAPNKWSEITLDEKTVSSGVADFSSIKTNTEKEDNGQWILFVGYILIGLSVLGVLYFIIATIAQRKIDKTAAMRRGASSAPAHSQATRMSERERRSNESINRYNDEIRNYSRRVSSRADTGEVYVPRRAKSK